MGEKTANDSAHADDGARERGGASEPAVGSKQLERLGRLVGGFAHEIKNPLSTIALNLRLMEEELAEPANAREKRFLKRTERVRREVDRLHGILESFLGYVRAPRPVLVEISLNEVVREVSELVAPEIEAKGMALRLLLTDGLADLPADGQLIHQVLINLVRNAEQALADSDAPGEIMIGTSIEEIDGRSWHQLSVTDNGPGMSEELIADCFRPYFSTKPQGTGLGLAITRRFVEDHGGSIRVESQLGIGTRFLVLFPSHANASDGESSSSPASPESGA